ncbi:MAG: ATP-binding protein [Lentisphaerae bacterium]|nr:ATP-binding protein [Lentisphaerota bacterium]
MSHCEFALQDILTDGVESRLPVLRRGMTSLEAISFLRREFPAHQDWFCWNPIRNYYGHYLTDLITQVDQREGTVGNWSWRRIPSSYPEVFYWTNDPKKKYHALNWTGVIEVQWPGNESFRLFSFLCSTGTVGQLYCVCAAQQDILHRFGLALEQQRRPQAEEHIWIHTTSGPDIKLNPRDEQIYLPGTLQQDIEAQCLSFFEDRQIYDQLGVPYKRGFLFVGQPGTGKTMMIRHLLRKIRAQHKDVRIHALTNASIDPDTLGEIMSWGRAENPIILIIEELDYFSQSSQTRQGLLTQLDGLEAHEGLILLATSNNPGEVDPALLHRPSRFDRVWHFEPPESDLRRHYLCDKFPECSASFLADLSLWTDGWTFAYMKELRMTAGIIAIRDHNGKMTSATVHRAYDLLAAQYSSGRKHHCFMPPRPLGFQAQ